MRLALGPSNLRSEQREDRPRGSASSNGSVASSNSFRRPAMRAEPIASLTFTACVYRKIEASSVPGAAPRFWRAIPAGLGARSLNMKDLSFINRPKVVEVVITDEAGLH